MAETNQVLKQVFSKAVPISFAFLVSEYGFSFAQEEEYLFRAESPFCRIVMELDKNRFGAWLERIGTLSVNDNPVHRAVGITVIALCFGHEFDNSIRFVSEVEELQSTIDLHAELLRRYCTPMFKGDFSDWTRLEVCLEEKKRLSQFKREKETKEYHLSDVRWKAETAWHGKDYAKLVTLYESMRDDLTSTEAKRLEYARKMESK